MTWQERLSESLDLTSPKGSTFSALWKGDSRSLEKLLGVFAYPKIKGNMVQDLGSNSLTYSIPIYFEGEDNDLESERFIKACQELGTWQILHPVKGSKTLQLVSLTENIQPLESGNLTLINTEWIEPLQEITEKSLTELRSDVLGLGLELNEISAAQFEANTSQATTAGTVATGLSIGKIATRAKETTQKLYENSAALNARILSVRRGIVDTLESVPRDLLSLAGQVQNLITLPALISGDISARMSYYSDLISAIIDDNDEDTSTSTQGEITVANRVEFKNKVAANELGLVAGLVAVSDISTSGTLATRTQAIETAERMQTFLNDINTSLDTVQESFDNAENMTLDFQYFSQVQSFPQVAELVAKTIDYLLVASYDLAIERRFTLDRDRAPIEITIEQYGSLGDNDENLDTFINSNNLKGNDILIIPAGREVVVYV